jgi:uncharacterized membrane protein
VNGVFDAGTVLAILSAAAVTYGLRAGGLLLAQRLPRSGPLRRGLEALPGAILVALVAPAIIHGGSWGMAAAVLVALIAHRSGNVFLAMLAGMAVVILQRGFGL